MSIRYSLVCEEGYKTYDPVGNLLAEQEAGAVVHNSYFDGELIDLCMEVCTTYVTAGYSFTSTYREAGDAMRCSELRTMYEDAGDPYNAVNQTWKHNGWSTDESLQYSASTTVVCCDTNECNVMCPETSVEFLYTIDGARLPGLSIAFVLALFASLCGGLLWRHR